MHISMTYIDIQKVCFPPNPRDIVIGYHDSESLTVQH